MAIVCNMQTSAVAQEIVNQGTPDPQGLDTRLSDAWLLLYKDPVLSRQLAQALLIEARDLPPQNAYARLNLAFLEMRVGDAEKAFEQFARLVSDFSELQELRGWMMAVCGLGVSESRLGRADQGFKRISAALPRGEPALKPFDEFIVHNGLGITASYDRGRMQECLRHYYKALSLARSLHMPAQEAMALSNIGSNQIDVGNYDDALGVLTQAWEMCQSQKHTVLMPVSCGNLALCQLALGHSSQASRTIESAIEPISVHLAELRADDLAFFEVIAAHTMVLQGEFDRAEDYVSRALEHTTLAFDNRVEAHCYWVTGLIERARGNLEEGLAALLAAAGKVEALDPYYPLQITRELGALCLALGYHEDSAIHYARHIQLQEEVSRKASQARYQTLKIRSELVDAERERDFARLQRAAAEHAQRELAALNTELQRKVSEIGALQTQLQEQAIRDPLTGLYNRRFLNEMIETALAGAMRSGKPLSLVMVDLDHFKRINDELGHPFGDVVLAATARHLRNSLRTSDIASRFGGEEFCLVLPDAGKTDARAVMEAMLHTYRNMVFRSGDRVVEALTFSAGVAELQPGDDFNALLARADAALYNAKAIGRDQVVTG